MKIVTGFESKLVSGEMPWCSAAASTIGLNDEPGCRSAWVARLNWLSRKFRPPTIALTEPSRGSMATSAAAGPFGSLRIFSIALCAEILQLEVDRRRDAQAAAEDASRAVLLHELALDVVDEVRRRPLPCPADDVLRLGQRRRVRAAHLRGGDLALLEHHREHVVAAARAPRAGS